ncbi:MAG: LysM peptidoglycan-binding domain-containing protein [Bacteroidota bacterium]|nr:LysM peptidoglycan-binding domain-containing protein [Bacteroidota bacterium]
MKKLFLGGIALFIFSAVFSQNITVQQYILLHKDFAIREMKRMGVPAAITLAQGLLETENGNSDLVKKSNNHFGIKCKSSWTAEGVSHDDDAPGECFRTYKDAEGSYRDHSNYLRGTDRYAFLFKLDPKDYKGWAYGLKKAGYATNPRYPDILIKNIEDNNLQQYTLVAANEVPFFDASRYQNDPEEKAFNEITKGKGGANAPVNNFTETSPKEKLTINGSKAIYETKGRSLLAIASENNINLNKLLEYNDLQKDGLLQEDQYIFLEKKLKEGDRGFYIVQKDETLYDVAQKNGIRLQNLFEYNNLKGDENISAGNKLNLKPSVKDPSITINNKPAVAFVVPQIKTYQVQPKEGLYTVARKYGVTVAQLKEWNNLPDDNLKVGQQLIVSK